MPNLVAPRMGKYALSAIPDTVDFRDRMFEPTLIEVPPTRPLDRYRSAMDGGLRILDQRQEGACTGFALGAVANYLLWTGKRRRDDGTVDGVSPWMFYAMAKRYDEWEGEDYEGSSARGAMKAWHKHGVCGSEVWGKGPEKEQDPDLWSSRWDDALRRPLGAYFRVNHKDIVAMHAALEEVGILYATAYVHTGWAPAAVSRSEGIIQYSDDKTGGHAFAIVGYEEDGFWIQNSWGDRWGLKGFALISYDDWLENGVDVWVGRLGAPIRLRRRESTALGVAPAAQQSKGYVFCDLRPHVVSAGNDGLPRTGGTFGTSADDIRKLIREDLAAYIDARSEETDAPAHVLLYAHGGLVSESAAVQRLADLRAPLLENGVFPVSFVWKSDYWSTATNILRDALSRRRYEGLLDASKDFMLDRLDDSLEPLARSLTGKAQWDEMKENAVLASLRKQGAARVAALALDEALGDAIRSGDVHLHVVGHSAGSIFMAPLVQLLAGAKGSKVAFELPGAPTRPDAAKGLGLPISTCTLWAPACTMALFAAAYRPLIDKGAIADFALFTLTEHAEEDDHCAKIYNKSLLYLVAHAFEAKARIPLIRPDGEPILGMAKFVHQKLDVLGKKSLKDLMKGWKASWVESPNEHAVGGPDAARCRDHGGFDDDDATLRSTLARILAVGGTRSAAVKTAKGLSLPFADSASWTRERRQTLDRNTRQMPSL